MRRLEFLSVLGGAATWPVAAKAQTPGRAYRIGYPAAVLVNLGYAEGR
jgi:hypothetical protein